MTSKQLIVESKALRIIGGAPTVADVDRVLTLLEGNTSNVSARFSLPRPASGSPLTLQSVGLVYTLSSGTLTSATPTLWRIVQTDGATETTTSVAIDAASPAFDLTASANVVSALNAVTTPAADTQAATDAVSYWYQVALVADADCTITIHGVVVNFLDEPAPTSSTAINNASSPVTLDANDSGTVFEVDMSGGAVQFDLPTLAAANTGVHYYIKVVTGDAANILSVVPDTGSGDDIVGLNATFANGIEINGPNPGDLTQVASNGQAGGSWYIVEASGAWVAI